MKALQWIKEHRGAILFDTVLFIVVIGGTLLYRSPVQSKDSASDKVATKSVSRITPKPLNTADLLSSINGYREYQGIAGMREDFVLDRAAQLHAEDMKARNYYDHTTPDGITAYQRITKAIGYEVYSGENQDNVCYNATVNDEFARFMGSLEHLSNQDDPRINTVGIGYIPSDPGKCNGYVVLDFAQL